MPLISVIVPVFNVEKYLKKCIESVINQNYKDIEIILVNDGSPDNCPRICEDFAQMDSRVKVIHKENEGLSAARNAGMKIAVGEYIMFLDSDDYWEGQDALMNIAVKIQHCKFDVLVYDCKDYNCITNEIEVSKKEYDHCLISSAAKDKVLKYLFEKRLFPGSAWITVTRRDFIIDNNIFFINGIKAEDIDWLLNVFTNAQSFASLDDAFYIYLKNRNNSITGTADIKSIRDVLFTISKWEKIIETKKYDSIKKYIYSYLSYHYITTFITYADLSKNKKKIAKKFINDYTHIFKNSNSKIIWCYNVFHSVLGIEIMSKLLNSHYNSKKYKKSSFHLNKKVI